MGLLEVPGCNSLISVTISDSVTSIGDYAFYGCEALDSIDISKTNDYYSSVDGVLFNKDINDVYQGGR